MQRFLLHSFSSLLSQEEEEEEAADGRLRRGKRDCELRSPESPRCRCKSLCVLQADDAADGDVEDDEEGDEEYDSDERQRRRELVSNKLKKYRDAEKASEEEEQQEKKSSRRYGGASLTSDLQRRRQLRSISRWQDFFIGLRKSLVTKWDAHQGAPPSCAKHRWQTHALRFTFYRLLDGLQPSASLKSAFCRI